MKMKYFMWVYTCGLGNTGASQQQNFNGIRLDGCAAMSPASLALLFWGQYWIQPGRCVSQWQGSFEERLLLLTPEFPALAAEDPVLLLGTK